MASIPSISTRATPAEIQRFARAVKNFLESGGLSLDTKAIASQIDRALRDYEERSNDLTPPGPPENLVVTGLFDKIMLEWGPATGNVAYYEVFRNMEDDLGNAVMVSPRIGAAMWVDTPPDSSLSATYYYWVRAVSPAGIAGPFNAAAGTPGSTADDPGFLMEVLADHYGDTSASPFFQVDDPIEINGVTVPAGTYIKTGFFHEAQITSALIKSLGADKITAGTITAAITTIGQYLRSSDSTVVLDMANKLFKMRSSAGHEVEITPGSVKFKRYGVALPIFEFTGDAVIIRNTSGQTLLQSGGYIQYDMVDGGPPSDADKTGSNKAYDTYRVGGDYQDSIVRAGNKITASNQATYISSLLVGNAWIGNAAVGTLSIAGRAVTFPVYGESTGGTVNINKEGAAGGTEIFIITFDFTTEYDEKNTVTYGGTLYIKEGSTVIHSEYVGKTVSVGTRSRWRHTYIANFDTSVTRTYEYDVYFVGDGLYHIGCTGIKVSAIGAKR